MEVLKVSPNVEFEVIYADGTRRRVQEGILYEAEPSRSIIFHNGSDSPPVLLAAAETALVSLQDMGFGLEALAMGMALGDESRTALASLVQFATRLLGLAKPEQQAIFRLGQKDMQANAAAKLRDAAAKMEPGGVVGSTLLLAADLIQGMEVP